MTGLELEGLAERCEQASGPDRGLFEQAFVACFGKASEDMRPDVAARWFDRWRQFSTFIDVGAWLDAAMMLVPKGLAWMCANSFSWGAYADTWDSNGIGPPRCIAATPALALTAASLRARSTLANTGEAK